MLPAFSWRPAVETCPLCRGRVRVWAHPASGSRATRAASPVDPTARHGARPKATLGCGRAAEPQGGERAAGGGAWGAVRPPAHGQLDPSGTRKSDVPGPGGRTSQAEGAAGRGGQGPGPVGARVCRPDGGRSHLPGGDATQRLLVPEPSGGSGPQRGPVRWARGRSGGRVPGATLRLVGPAGP